MIVQFSVSNYRTIRDKVTLSLLSTLFVREKNQSRNILRTLTAATVS